MTNSLPRLRLRWQTIWLLHPPVALVVRAAPAQCLQMLMASAKPSTQRLHLRNLFAEGRRYYVQPLQDGFKLTSDNRLLWGSRRRAPVAAVVLGKFSSPQDEITFIRLHSRVSIPYFITGLFIPLFFSSVIVLMPWSPLAIALLVALLFALSLIGQRFNAALQVNEMVYFVQKVMEDLPQIEVAELPASGPDVVMRHSDFREQWYKFYREQTQSQTKPDQEN